MPFQQIANFDDIAAFTIRDFQLLISFKTYSEIYATSPLSLQKTLNFKNCSDFIRDIILYEYNKIKADNVEIDGKNGKCFLNNSLLLTFDYNENGYQVDKETIYNIQSNEIVLSYDFQSRNLMLDEKSNSVFIERFDMNEGKTGGVYNLNLDSKINTEIKLKPAETQITRFIGAYRNTFWACLTDGNLLAIDTDILTEKTIIELNREICSQRISNLGAFSQLDSTSGKLIGLRGKTYWEVDLNAATLKLEIYDISDSATKYEIQSADMPSYLWPISDKYIYICDGPNATIALFDRQKKEVIASQQLFKPQSSFSQILKMEVHNGRLYIKDIKNKLLILEHNS